MKAAHLTVAPDDRSDSLAQQVALLRRENALLHRMIALDWDRDQHDPRAVAAAWEELAAACDAAGAHDLARACRSRRRGWRR